MEPHRTLSECENSDSLTCSARVSVQPLAYSPGPVHQVPDPGVRPVPWLQPGRIIPETIIARGETSANTVIPIMNADNPTIPLRAWKPLMHPSLPGPQLKRCMSNQSSNTGQARAIPGMMAAMFGPIPTSFATPLANEDTNAVHAPCEAHLAAEGKSVNTRDRVPPPTKNPGGVTSNPGAIWHAMFGPVGQPVVLSHNESKPVPAETPAEQRQTASVALPEPPQSHNLATKLFGHMARPPDKLSVNMLASSMRLSKNGWAAPTPAWSTNDRVPENVHVSHDRATQSDPVFSKNASNLVNATTARDDFASVARSGLSQGKSRLSIPTSKASSEGRAAKQTMHNAARVHLTLEKIEELGRNPMCKCTQGSCCLHRDDLPERMALASVIHILWAQFNGAAQDFHKGQALLDYMYDNQAVSAGRKKKVTFKLAPGTETGICPSCWRLCAGFTKENGRESTLYAHIRALFNAGIRNAVEERVTDEPHKVTRANKNELKVAVVAFLDSWLQDNSDSIPEDTAFNDHGPPRVHVDVPRKRDIWVACCDYLDKHYQPGLGRNTIKEQDHPPMVSIDWFLKLLNTKVDVVIHKHKKFSQCVTCFLFKQLIAKCKNPEDIAEIRAHRRRHFDTVFGERVIYHQCRAWAKDNPELALSLILDAQSAWRTRGPTLPREVGSGGFPGDFEAFGQQLYGCLVHALPGDETYKGGFFGYMVDDSVKGGGNVTCEILYKTLAKLQEHRQVWPPLLDIRLDNTTKDNKNKCVFGFMGWLVLTDVFQTVRVRYLSVGHTHEDIDALFGVLMQHLYRGQCFATIEILMDAIYESFFTTNNKHASGNRPSAKLEHLRATHNWTGWLTTACEEQGATIGKPRSLPSVSKIEHYARRVPDSHRPHEFVFSKMQVDGAQRVVVNYKHWSRDEVYWNKNPIVVFNHEPNLLDLQPALLNPKVIAPLAQCAAAPDFTDDALLCSAKAGPRDAEGESKSSLLKNCPRCKVHVAFGTEHKSSAMFTQSDKDAWARRWSEMTQASANESLCTVQELRTYNKKEPRLPFAMPTCMAGPSAAYLSVEPVTFDGYTEPMYQRLLKQAGVGITDDLFKEDSTVSYAVQEVIGVKRDKKGAIEAAVIWADDTTADGGTWIPLANLNAEFAGAAADDREDDNDADFRAPSQKRMDMQMDNAVSRHNWERYFGREVDEDLDVICGFTQGRNTTFYLGAIVTADFDEHTGFHHVLFPICQANSLFGTAPNAAADYMNLRLDTLEAVLDVGESDEAIMFWVKRDYVGLPFITKHLPSLKVGALPESSTAVAKRRKRFQSKASPKRNPPSKSSSGQESATDDDDLQPIKKFTNPDASSSDEYEAKQGKPKPKQKALKKKRTSSLQYQGLMRKMRRGGY